MDPDNSTMDKLYRKSEGRQRCRKPVDRRPGSGARTVVWSPGGPDPLRIRAGIDLETIAVLLGADAEPPGEEQERLRVGVVGGGRGDLGPVDPLADRAGAGEQRPQVAEPAR